MIEKKSNIISFELLAVEFDRISCLKIVSKSILSDQVRRNLVQGEEERENSGKIHFFELVFFRSELFQLCFGIFQNRSCIYVYILRQERHQ